MSITTNEQLIYYGGLLYYEMAEKLKQDFEIALGDDINNLENNLKNIKVINLWNEAKKSVANKDTFNVKQTTFGGTPITDGLRLVPRGNKMFKKSPSKRRRKSRS